MLIPLLVLQVGHLRRWLSGWGAPMYLCAAVIDHHEVLYAERGGVDESAVLADLPPLLRQSVRARMRMHTLGSPSLPLALRPFGCFHPSVWVLMPPTSLAPLFPCCRCARTCSAA